LKALLSAGRERIAEHFYLPPLMIIASFFAAKSFVKAGCKD
jgi:hypothetical protein